MLYMVRHGETVWNREGRFQGQQDAPLSDDGRRQAELLSRRLFSLAGEKGFDAVWSSDLDRARLTAQALAAPYGLPVRTHAGLREMNFGAWEGLTIEEIRTRFPEDLAAYQRDGARMAPTGGESFLEMIDRSACVLDALWAEGARRVVVVSHGGTIKGLLCHLLGLPPESRKRLILGNTGLTVVRMQRETARLLLYNDTGHLEGEGEAWRR